MSSLEPLQRRQYVLPLLHAADSKDKVFPIQADPRLAY